HTIDPAKYGVLTFFDVFGTLWVKPTFDQPITRIQSNGTFSIPLQNIGQDPCAGRIIVLAVPLTYHVSIQTSVSVIPPEVEAVAIAKTIAERGFSKTIKAFGYTFVVKDTASCVWGPGPNYFASNNVRLDSDGKVHLTLSYVNGAWRAAEIISDQ